jgi:hypothetical protein
VLKGFKEVQVQQVVQVLKELKVDKEPKGHQQGLKVIQDQQVPKELKVVEVR